MRRRLSRLVDVLFGEGAATGVEPDDLYDLSTGWVTLASHGYESTGTAGLCFSNVSSVEFDAVVEEVEDLLAVATDGPEQSWDVVDDDYGYHWVVLSGADFEAILDGVHMVADTIVERGYESSLLSAVFAFEDDREIYWIYNFTRGTWYPFAQEGTGDRDESLESELRGVVGTELDPETDSDRRYPLWDVPF